MSAWKLGHAHINALVQIALRHEVSGPPPDDLGQMLWRENYKSTNYRYSERCRAPNFVFNARAKQPNDLEALKIVNCYQYQTCEHPGWPQSDAYALCKTLEDQLYEKLGHEARDEYPRGWRQAKGWPWEGRDDD